MQYHSTHHHFIVCLLLSSLHTAFSQNSFPLWFLLQIRFVINISQNAFCKNIFNFQLKLETFVLFCLRIAFFFVVSWLLVIVFSSSLDCLKTGLASECVHCTVSKSRHSQINLTLIKHRRIVKFFGKWILINTDSSIIQSDSWVLLIQNKNKIWWLEGYTSANLPHPMLGH